MIGDVSEAEGRSLGFLIRTAHGLVDKACARSSQYVLQNITRRPSFLLLY